jgi:hypothetical protein
MNEATTRLAAATSKSWLDLENFMRIFRQQGNSWAPQKNLVFNQVNLRSTRFRLKSTLAQIPARAANGRAGTCIMFAGDSEASGTPQAAPASLSQLDRRTPRSFYPVRPSTRHHVG